MPTQLEQLKRYSTIVADTGDIESIRQYRPEDVTTNPSLILQAAKMPGYHTLIHKSIANAGITEKNDHDRIKAASDWLMVQIAKKIAQLVPGRVSMEVDASLSFDTKATFQKACQMIELCQKNDLDPGRILIKIASTWEGIRAAEMLEKKGMHCNLTLLFSLPQAMACADAGVFLISPFVGRITDWYKKKEGITDYPADLDPGVNSVRSIYHHYKNHGYKTAIMAASFRNTGQILALAGCDRLTISPTLLSQLDSAHAPVKRTLMANKKNSTSPCEPISKLRFHRQMKENAMATEKLNEGIQTFSHDWKKLEQLIKASASHGS